ncbi:hypothetical protein [Xanthobacter wiegelii]|uniref:hypothetical protein n=1 Tax=Xanthobacter wiegelii TaxID=3119913 RepID=UPI0037283E63
MILESVLVSTIIGKLKSYLLPIAVGAGLVLSVWFAWNHYENLKEERDTLRTQVEQVTAENVQLKITQSVLEDRATETVERTKELNDIKREIYETPSSSVPADIGRALERLRQRESARNP